MEINERFKLVRNQLDINQKELAEKVEVSSTVITMIESGERSPSRNVLIKLAEIYNVDITWLLTGKGEMFIRTEEAAETPSYADAVSLLNDFAKLDAEGRMVVKDVIGDLLG